MAAPAFASRSILAGLAPLDRARVRLLHALKPFSSRLAADREARVAVIGVASVLLAGLLTLLLPLWMLALGPILLGVPHLFADVRYGVVRPGWHRRPEIWLAVFAPLAWASAGGGLPAGMAAVAGAFLVLDGPRWKAAVGVAAAGLLGWLAWSSPRTATLLAMHGHNLIAIGLWLAWRGRQERHHYWVLLTIVAMAAAIAVAPLPSFFSVGPDARYLTLEGHLARMAPGFSPAAGVRIVLLFCFLQAVHYTVWLRLVREEDRPRPTPRTFAASYRALEAEFGLAPLVVTALMVVGLGVWACVDLSRAHFGYLRFAQFHFSLELCMGASLWLAAETGTDPTRRHEHGRT